MGVDRLGLRLHIKEDFCPNLDSEVDYSDFSWFILISSRQPPG
jgi:hypothetical protein